MGMKTPEEINIEELKTGIERCIIYLNAGPSEESCDKCPYEGKCSRLEKDALALIQRLEAQVPKWISVEERLPKPYENVIVYREHHNPVHGHCVIDYIELTGQGGFEWSKSCASWKYVVTHWMPLPEPPKED